MMGASNSALICGSAFNRSVGTLSIPGALLFFKLFTALIISDNVGLSQEIDNCTMFSETSSFASSPSSCGVPNVFWKCSFYFFSCSLSVVSKMPVSDLKFFDRFEPFPVNLLVIW
ncbi:hypothetical protein HHI36_009453 [Cryptolaemus montrouzieri]|uniref:Secreted protein n=1 Tax=Cryptolaemus montrouzieri TaxID=559131 RepID=A0ABD2MFM5_9CUCU